MTEYLYLHFTKQEEGEIHLTRISTDNLTWYRIPTELRSLPLHKELACLKVVNNCTVSITQVRGFRNIKVVFTENLKSFYQDELGNFAINDFYLQEYLQLETLKEIFSNGPCVIIFFRRWGCVYCRLWARELSEIAPILMEHNIRFIGVGIDEIGKNEFISGKFFDGEIYQDYLKRTYSGMQFKRTNYLSLLLTKFYSESRFARSKIHKMKLEGNLKGDKLQNGGLLIIDKKGEIIYEFRQERPSHFVSNDEILKVLKQEVFSNENLTHLKEGELDIKQNDENNLPVMAEEIEKSSNETILNKEIGKSEILNKLNLQEDLDKIEKVELQDSYYEPSHK